MLNKYFRLPISLMVGFILITFSSSTAWAQGCAGCENVLEECLQDGNSYEYCSGVALACICGNCGICGADAEQVVKGYKNDL